MSASPSIPGLYYTAVQPAAQPSPLRTDVAGFFGRTVRGPVGTAERVAGWREYLSVFGDLSKDAMTPYAVKGYFDNQAQVAYVIRLLGSASKCAPATWNAGKIDATSGTLGPDWPGASGLRAIEFQIEATSPGNWANKTTVDIRYWAVGRAGKPEFEFEITPPKEAAELLTGIDPATIDTEVNDQSNYILLTPAALPAVLTPRALSPPAVTGGPRYYEWPRVTLSGGTSLAPTKEDYLAAVTVLGDQSEVALVACPDVYPDLGDATDQLEVIATMLEQASRLDDRLVIIDVPPIRPIRSPR